MRTLSAFAACLVVNVLRAQTPCFCNVEITKTMFERQCSLGRVTEEQPRDIRVFFVPDANPKKPNRLLALPREQITGLQRIADLSPETRLELWTKAIEKAKEKWGDRWGIAYNGDNVRTQCHVHIHIGRLIEGVEAGDFLVVDGPAQIPIPGKDGYWIHPVAGKLHVHTGEQICETVLLR
jgi:diadenosine tetraphosphate (Ap4A) HIT family hydrolase